MLRVIGCILFLGITPLLYGQGEYEAEEFVSKIDLEFEVKQMQKSAYIGSAIICEQAREESCDSLPNVYFESHKGSIKLPVKGFSAIQHYTADTLEEMSAGNPQINRLIISAIPNSNVYASFEGEVTAVFSIPGNETVIMIKNGSYRIVYGGLQSINHSIGDWISSGAVLGSVGDAVEANKVVFEIWKSSNGTNESLPVEQWIELVN